MSKRTRTSKVEKWIKEGRGSGIGADYKPWLNIRNVSSLGRSTRLKGIKTNRQLTESGFDLEMIGKGKAKSSLMRWKNTYKIYGEQGFLEERRGKGSTGRPTSNSLSADKKLEKAEARIKYLEAELELLKKLDQLERQARKKL